MSDDAGERSEEATQARREEFRSQGQVAHTRELATSLFLLLGTGLIYASSSMFYESIHRIFTICFGSDAVYAMKHADFSPIVKAVGLEGLKILSPIFILMAIVAVMSSVLQFGLINVEEALSPKLDKIDPLQGLQRMFSLRSVVEGLKSLVKINVVLFIVYLVVKNDVAKFPGLIQSPIEHIIEYMGHRSALLIGSVGMVMLAIALGDYFYQRWELEKQMRMTKQEIKEEHKSREGDPLIKARIRRIQRDLANRRMMEKVPKADVIVTNPTHIAVALKYDKNLPAPQLIAKGADLIAQKMKALAAEHNIPIVENKPLARTIFKTLKIGQVVPRDLYVAVAEVLSYVYKLKKKSIQGA